ncbi:pantoate kinase [Sulfurisphaera ohwakuensis]|uniref:Pantoate kinase n=1 Tax=Sulfurisphaera ohwakuensis TaxID=69656 RepID=A0A650CEF5_SULOH|nr:pantoate kinase [Sulfurisphaera ohwakuensis]MBB5252883.1 pantoate kinase [Sulfurisphaera ohwakuensis]QGR16184.1 GHMP kinase [Sulfurisphaera ohwakuensis]
MTDIEIIVPLNISGIWYPVYTEDIRYTGSIGLSLVLNPPIIAFPKKGDPEIYFNTQRVNFPNLKYLSLLANVKLYIQSEVPLGFGYGLSGAISLAYALASYELYNIKLEDALVVAHESEIFTNNGLGDLISEYYGGGLVYRKKPGAPGYGEVEKIIVEWEPICSKPLSKESTEKLIKNKNDNALVYINQFLHNPSLLKFFELSRKFTEEIGFISPFPNSFRKKGLILRLKECEEGWIKHTPAIHGAYIR